MREGGYVDHPHDAGQCTNYGISRRTLAAVRGTASCDDVKHLSESEAREIYHQQYFLPAAWAENLLWFELYFDMCVLHGPETAASLLQQALLHLGKKLVLDGVVGSVTRSAANLSDERDLAVQLLAVRYRYLFDIVARDHSQCSFIRGWINRHNEFLEILQ